MPQVQTALSPFSSVRIRMASVTSETKILPSPILPVLAALMMAAVASFTLVSDTTSSILILGRKSTVYFATAVNFSMAFLATEALDLGDGHSLDADVMESVFDLLEFEGFYYCFDFLHVCYFLLLKGCR